MKSSILACVVVLAASPALAADDGYPPGLFEHSPLVGPNGAVESQGSQASPSDAGDPPEGSGSLDDFCASVAGRTFHSLAEVKRAHARCDPAQGGGPPPDQ
jgi:hypothetical protein